MWAKRWKYIKEKQYDRNGKSNNKVQRQRMTASAVEALGGSIKDSFDSINAVSQMYLSIR